MSTEDTAVYSQIPILSIFFRSVNRRDGVNQCQRRCGNGRKGGYDRKENFNALNKF